MESDQEYDYVGEGRKMFEASDAAKRFTWESLAPAVKACWCEVAYQLEFGVPSDPSMG